MNKNIHNNKILIIDFGSQYTQLIARRVREIGVYCEVYPYHIAEEKIQAFKPNGIILSGGPETTLGDDSPKAADIIFQLGCPVLGICYGMQTMADQLGGEVAKSDQREFGAASISLHGHSKLLSDIQDERTTDGDELLKVWMSHGDKVICLPKGFRTTASTSTCPMAAMADDERRFYGLQFHPEVTHTPQGLNILSRFVLDICQCEALWTTANIIEDSVESIQKQVGKGKVLLALSGGVDSSVTALLLHKAIGDQLTCVFVDTGLLRLNEANQVMDTFSKHLGLNVIKVDAAEKFYQALKGITEPEEKRKTAGRLFIEVFDEEAEKLNNVKWLAQGTIYPDVIESAAHSDSAHVIKSHHNVGGLPEDMPFELIEPLRELFKDEVRRVGLELGLASEMLHRHPFPGPGLALRVIGEIKSEYVSILQYADNIFIEELRKHDLYHKVSQAFAVFLPIKSVAVKGDARCYEYVITLRAVETIDFMTAHWSHLPHDFLAHVANRICNEVDHVSRVVYDITGKPPATIEWE